MCLPEVTLVPHSHAALLLCNPLTPRYSILSLLVLFCAASIVSSMISWANESIKACAISCKQPMLHSTSSVKLLFTSVTSFLFHRLGCAYQLVLAALQNLELGFYPQTWFRIWSAALSGSWHIAVSWSPKISFAPHLPWPLCQASPWSPVGSQRI